MADTKLDLNRADLDQLAAVPFLGQQRAEAILRYRQANGGFTTLDELQEITGIGPKLGQSMRDFLTVGSADGRTDDSGQTEEHMRRKRNRTGKSRSRR